MFLHLSVSHSIHRGSVRGEGGHAWQKERGGCVVKGGMHGRGGHEWQGGACMAGGTEAGILLEH